MLIYRAIIYTELKNIYISRIAVVTASSSLKNRLFEAVTILVQYLYLSGVDSNLTNSYERTKNEISKHDMGNHGSNR